MDPTVIRGEWRRRIAGPGPPVVGMIATVLLFLFAVRLLGTATEAASPLVERLFDLLIAGEASALGVSWLATYGLMNGSVVAALSISLARTGIVDEVDLYLLVAGSRLGAAAVVVLLGGLDFVHHREGTLAEATSMGLLTFILTITVYVPATVIGYLALPRSLPLVRRAGRSLAPSVAPLAHLDPLTDAVSRTLGPAPTVVVAIGVLFGCLRLFDVLLERVDTSTIRRVISGRVGGRWTALWVGLVVTGLTTSVAFSLGVVVPLYNRGLVEREEVVPYVLGANLGTLADTLVVALILESPDGVAVVLVLAAAALVVTVLLMLAFRPYRDAIDVVQDRLLADRRYYLGFVLLLIVVPLALTLVG